MTVLRFEGAGSPSELVPPSVLPGLHGPQFVLDEEFLQGFQMVGRRKVVAYPEVVSLYALRGYTPTRREPLTIQEVMDLIVQRGYEFPHIEEALRFADEDTEWLRNFMDILVLAPMDVVGNQKLVRMGQGHEGIDIRYSLDKVIQDHQYLLLIRCRRTF